METNTAPQIPALRGVKFAIPYTLRMEYLPLSQDFLWQFPRHVADAAPKDTEHLVRNSFSIRVCPLFSSVGELVRDINQKMPPDAVAIKEITAAPGGSQYDMTLFVVYYKPISLRMA